MTVSLSYGMLLVEQWHALSILKTQSFHSHRTLTAILSLYLGVKMVLLVCWVTLRSVALYYMHGLWLNDYQDPWSAHPVTTGTKFVVYCLDVDPISGKLAIGVDPGVNQVMADSEITCPYLWPGNSHTYSFHFFILVSHFHHTTTTTPTPLDRLV